MSHFQGKFEHNTIVARMKNRRPEKPTRRLGSRQQPMSIRFDAKRELQGPVGQFSNSALSRKVGISRASRISRRPGVGSYAAFRTGEQRFDGQKSCRTSGSEFTYRHVRHCLHLRCHVHHHLRYRVHRRRHCHGRRRRHQLARYHHRVRCHRRRPVVDCVD